MQLKKPLVILIGISEYNNSNLLPLKSAETNIGRLKELFLRDFRLSSSNVVYFNSNTFEHMHQYSKKIKELKKTEDFDSVIYYYSGHGILNDESKYFLSLKNTDIENISTTSIDVEENRKWICEIADKKPIIFIIDACFSVRFQESINPNSVGNYLYITSGRKKNETSLYPKDEEFSVFSGALITSIQSLIRKGNNKIFIQSIIEKINEIIDEKNERNEGDINKYSKPSILDHEVLSTRTFLETPAIKNDKNEVALDILKSMWVKDKTISEIIDNLPSYIERDELMDEILKRFPIVISNTLLKIIAKPDDLSINSYIHYYKQIITFLTFNLIVDVTNNKNMSDELKGLLNKLSKPTHQIYTDIFQLILNENKYIFFKDSFQNKQIIITKIDELNRLIVNDELIESIGKPKLRIHIIEFIKLLYFLVDFKWIAVRTINVRKHYAFSEYFMHQYSILSGVQPDEYKEGLRLSRTLFSSSIIVAKCNYIEFFTDSTVFLNLWPFLIDRNSFFQIQKDFENDDTKSDKLIFRSPYGKQSIPSLYFYSKIEGEDLIFDDIKEESNGHKYKDIHQTLPPDEYKHNFDFFSKSILQTNNR